MNEQIAAHNWPERKDAATSDLLRYHLAVIALLTQAGETRENVRMQLRNAVVDFVAHAFSCPGDAVGLHAVPGKPPTLHVRGQPLYLSVAHEEQLSVAAISLHDAVGVDIAKMDMAFYWEDVANLFLSPQSRQRISAQTNEQLKRRAFYMEWTALEAMLKYNGQALSEYSEERTRQLELQPAPACLPMHLPFPYLGNICIGTTNNIVSLIASRQHSK